MASCSYVRRENPSPQSQPQWSELPTELLEIISRKIADIADFARFRSVCKSWRYAAKPINLSPQLPWLLLPHDPNTSDRSFYSLSARSTYTLDLPQTRNQIIYGSSNGWLVMFDETLTVSLFNPLTRSLIRLPPITTIPEDWRSTSFFENAITLESASVIFDCYAFVSPNSNSSNIDGIVAFLVDGSAMFLYWRPGDESWAEMDTGLQGCFEAMSFRNGKFYAIDWIGDTAICDLEPSGKTMIIPSLKLANPLSNPSLYDYRYCLVTSSEELLLVTISTEYEDDMSFRLSKTRLEYHKLDESDDTMTWMQLPDFGDCVVFMPEEVFVNPTKLMPVACVVPGLGRICLCSAIPGRNGLQVSCLDAIVIEHAHGGLYTSREALNLKLMNTSWIIPSLS